ncbi:hypothetical protein F2P81_025092 [Scophthalmus maximus]|uniref:Uncharacterized protein n=1 Tax=Scophthalmus maximus TaxID=52904 RepID=A0A6A4RTK7_SCOMX|nr:hypothetical protein F2P81_025092 [Scophthalmus maximus]
MAEGGVVHTVQTHERRAAFHVVSQTKSGSSAVDPGTKSCTFMCKCIVFVRVNSPRDFIHGKSIPPSREPVLIRRLVVFLMQLMRSSIPIYLCFSLKHVSFYEPAATGTN